MEDRLKSVRRAQKKNRFGNSGSEIYLEDKADSTYKYYAVQFHQNVFVEGDPSKDCTEYPNTHFESYAECDSDFVEKFLERNFPKGFLPVWATEDLANVTELMYLNGKVSQMQLTALMDLVAGTALPDCRPPCKSTEIKTVFVDEKNVAGDKSKIDIAFSNFVSIKRTDFPKFKLASFVSILGGSMGFWLGLGVVQILELLILVCRGKVE